MRPHSPHSVALSLRVLPGCLAMHAIQVTPRLGKPPALHASLANASPRLPVYLHDGSSWLA